MGEVRFKLGEGEELEFPALSELTFAEAVVACRISGCSLAELYTAPTEVRVAAQVGVALARAHADWPTQRVVESVLWSDISTFQWVGGVEEEPEPDPLSPSETSGSTGSQGSTVSVGESSEPLA